MCVNCRPTLHCNQQTCFKVLQQYYFIGYRYSPYYYKEFWRLSRRWDDDINMKLKDMVRHNADFFK